MPKNLAPILGSKIGGTGSTSGSRRVLKVAGTAWVKGDLLKKGTGGDTNKWNKADTAAVGPFAFAVEDATAAATTGSVFDDIGSEINATADGAITPNSYVMRSGTTAGQVIAYTGTDETLIVGRYLRHEGEDSADQTDAADGDIIVVRLGYQGPQAL
jgi:hypothetical protein